MLGRRMLLSVAAVLLCFCGAAHADAIALQPPDDGHAPHCRCVSGVAREARSANARALGRPPPPGTLLGHHEGHAVAAGACGAPDQAPADGVRPAVCRSRPCASRTWLLPSQARCRHANAAPKASAGSWGAQAASQLPTTTCARRRCLPDARPRPSPTPCSWPRLVFVPFVPKTDFYLVNHTMVNTCDG